MFSSIKPGRGRFGVLVLGFFVFTLFLTSNARSQQLSLPGLPSPVEKSPDVRKALPASQRAARGEAPLNRLYDFVKVDQMKVRRLPALKSEDLKAQSSKKVRIGTVRTLTRAAELESDSARYTIAEGEVRVIGIVSEGAVYTRVHFSQMSLPAGARVFVYSLKNPEDFQGPYENNGPSNDGTFWTPPLEGDAVAIEYFTPGGVADSTNGAFRVTDVSHIYRDLFTGGSQEVAGPCNLEVTSDWAEVAKSVGYLTFTTSGGEFACTGTLLNNPANDQTPFLLTANHCFDTQTEAQTLRVWWNYNTGESPTGPVTDGSNLLATGTSSDYTLVRLTGTVPGGLFYAGWDATPTSVGTSVAGIHHPENSHKRIAFGSTNSTCVNGLPGPCSNFTHVRWSSGTTEPGSSGSGLWKGSSTNAQLVGTLTGGEAACSNLSGIDEYGSFSTTYPNISTFLTGGGADLSLSKTTAFDQVAPGSKVVYFLTVTNSIGGTASSITVTDNLPAQVTFSSCSANGGTCGGSGNNRTITFPSLAPGASATAVLIATVNNSVSNGTVISNTASVSSSTSDSNQNNNTSTATATVTSSPIQAKANGKIAYLSDRAGSGSSLPSGLYTINSNGLNDATLIAGEGFGAAPAWSPDGTKIAYGKRGFNTFDSEIYVANADGTGAVKVASNAYNQNSQVTWSPNGAKLAFVGTGNAVHVVNANGTGLARLPNPPAFVNDLAWSRDGSKFAYSNGGDVFVMSIDSTGQTNLTTGRVSIQGEPAGNKLPRWSPDGTRLVFSAESNNYKNVYVMNADGTGLAPLITLHQSMQPAWSPDGTKITFVTLNFLYTANADGSGAVQIGGGGTYNTKPDWQPLAAGTPTVGLSANNYNIGEAGGHVTLTVNRSSSVGTATVNYATSDNSGLNPCSMVSTLASSRCDYATTIGTLRFAAGETSRSIFIPIVDDSYAEGLLETFTLTLSNPTGAILGANATATITIQDDALPNTNPIFDNAFFIREHYIDFLGREPDAGGYQGWQNILNNCPASGKDANGNYCDRIEVSSAFFRSEEFQSRGYFAYRFYPTIGKIPVYPEFMPDLAKLSGFLSAAELEANKVAFTTEFMNRTEFKNRYDSLTTPTAYVDGLLQTVGLPTHSAKAGWTTGLGNGSLTRAQVLRQLVDSAELSQKFYNEAFVIMQYFGYLRRTADASYTQWIQTMNGNGGDYRVMINGFMNSTEYRQRFGQ